MATFAAILRRDEVPDQTPRSFHKRELVCKTALQQNTNGIVVEDFRRELAEIQNPIAKHIFILAKASHLM